jgi:hypothetical protein
MSLPFPCPFCAEPIREEAFRCSHCHAWLVPWTYRHKWVPGLVGLGGGVFLIYDGAREQFLTDLPGWLLIVLGALASLYGLYHLLRSTRSAFEEGRKDLLERYRKRAEEEKEED